MFEDVLPDSKLFTLFWTCVGSPNAFVLLLSAVADGQPFFIAKKITLLLVSKGVFDYLNVPHAAFPTGRTGI